MNRVYWVGVACATGAGLIIGFVTGVATVEERVRRRYEEAAKSRMEAMRLAEILQQNRETFVEESEKPISKTVLGVVSETNHHNVFDPRPFEPAEQNPYHKSLVAQETPVEQFVEGGVNDYGISYIEEEEYYDDDGRNKEQISIIIQDFGPVFLMHGEEIQDWDERVGDSIVVDMMKLGVTGQLFVRNHKTDEDYEVLLEQP